MTHTEIVKKLIGPIEPVGKSEVDADRMENLKALCLLVDNLVGDIMRCAENKKAYEASVKQAGLHADNFLIGLVRDLGIESKNTEIVIDIEQVLRGDVNDVYSKMQAIKDILK